MTTPVVYEYQVGERALEGRRWQLDPSIAVFGTWEIEPIQEALRLRTLTENWDGEGSPTPTQAAVESTIQIISAVATLGFDELPTPRLYPVHGGGVQLEWRQANRYLEIEFMPEGTAHFLTATDQEPQRDEDLPVWAPMQVKPLIGWLLAGA